MIKTLKSESYDVELKKKALGFYQLSYQHLGRCLEFCILVIRICFVLQDSEFGFNLMGGCPRPLPGGFLRSPALREELSLFGV